ncbi:oxidoreductase [candidate division CSSED10-310 bacterium]|uniref:Oxidoreductase n=1 Tax=candidate division CSSED10-310 bacterium TaxID=2855610 RepID=A0ABV6YT30_UNCC1
MTTKPTLAFYWCASCGGCEESVMDLAEDILMVFDTCQFVFFPVALDYKKSDVEAMPDHSITLSMINGAIRTTENEEMARLLRKKSKTVIAYGSCAHLGGIPSLANQFAKQDILSYVYEQADSVQNDEKIYPLEIIQDNGQKVTLPTLYNQVRCLNQVIKVDYYIPGCPPPPKLAQEALLALLNDALPPPGAILAPDIALCEQCPRLDSKPLDLRLERYKRPHLHPIDSEICLLAQGFVCLGPATRGGCEARCIQGNMPCTGCFGPVSGVKDHGAKILSYLCSAASGTAVEDLEVVFAGIPDLVGIFYRYGLAASLLPRKISTK